MVKVDGNFESVLSNSQKEIFPILKDINKTCFLIGETAIALHLKHRKTNTFQFLSLQQQMDYKENYKNKLSIDGINTNIIDFFDNTIVKGNFSSLEKNTLYGIRTFDLTTLGAITLFKLIYKNNWERAVDLFFIVQSGIGINELLKKGKEIFGDMFFEDDIVKSIISYSFRGHGWYKNYIQDINNNNAINSAMNNNGTDSINNKTKENQKDLSLRDFDVKWDKKNEIKYLINNYPTDDEIQDSLLSLFYY